MDMKSGVRNFNAKRDTFILLAHAIPSGKIVCETFIYEYRHILIPEHDHFESVHEKDFEAHVIIEYHKT